MENINDILKNQGGENNQPSTTGYQNPVVPSTGYKNPTPPKKDNKKLIAIISVIAAVVVVAVAVTSIFIFGGKPQNVTNLNGNGIISGNSQEGHFDIEEVINNITIDGEHFEWFSSLNDLGSDWDWAEFGTPSIMGEDETEATAVVEYKGEEVFTCGLCNYDKEHERDALIYGMRVTNDRVSIDGLMVGDSKKDVLKKFGEPTSCDQGLFYYTIESNSKELIISFENEKIYSLHVTYRLE